MSLLVSGKRGVLPVVLFALLTGLGPGSSACRSPRPVRSVLPHCSFRRKLRTKNVSGYTAMRATRPSSYPSMRTVISISGISLCADCARTPTVRFASIRHSWISAFRFVCGKTRIPRRSQNPILEWHPGASRTIPARSAIAGIAGRCWTNCTVQSAEAAAGRAGFPGLRQRSLELQHSWLQSGRKSWLTATHFNAFCADAGRR